MNTGASGFAGQLDLHALGSQSDEALLSAFLDATFFCQAPEHPGFLAIPTPRGSVIAAYTSEVALASHAGACRWFSTSGADLIALAPVGHRFVIDPDTHHQIVVDPQIFLRRVAGLGA